MTMEQQTGSSKAGNALKAFLSPFLTGLIVLLPVLLTIGVVAAIADFLLKLVGPDTFLGALFKKFGLNFGASETGAYIGGVLTSIAILYFFGVLCQRGLKGRWEVWSDRLFNKIPLIGTLYDALKKFSQLLQPKENADLKSMTPVMVTFGGDGGTSVPAFLPTGETIEINDKDYCTVMIPTAPVPFGGALFCVPSSWVSELDVGVEGLFAIYMSMGTSLPGYFNKEVEPRPGDEPPK